MKLSHIFLTLVFLTVLPIGLAAQSSTSKVGTSSAVESKSKKSFRPTKSQIKTAQEKLESAGTFKGEVTGRYSKEFRAALRTFQESNSLELTGKLDEATLLKLDIPLTDRQRGIVPEKKSKRRSFRVSKEQISAAQSLLKSSGNYDGPVNGKYSKDLRNSIKEYQSANGLARKGSLNRSTLEKMGIELTETQKQFPRNPKNLASEKKKRGPVFRATKAQIVEVQKMLAGKNLYQGETTGKLNNETRAAIRNWQKSNGVKVTGTLNKQTLTAMGIELTENQKSR